MFSESDSHPFDLILDPLSRVSLFATSDSPVGHAPKQAILSKRLDTYSKVYRPEGYVERLSTHIRIRTDQVTRTRNVVLYQSHQHTILFHPPSQRRFPSTLSPGQHVPDPHCNHLILKLSIHLRQRHRSLQEEDQERSPFPSADRQTPELSFSRCRPQHTLRTNSRVRPIFWYR